MKNFYKIMFREVFQYLSNSMSFRSQNNNFDKAPRVTNVSGVILKRNASVAIAAKTSRDRFAKDSYYRHQKGLLIVATQRKAELRDGQSSL